MKLKCFCYYMTSCFWKSELHRERSASPPPKSHNDQGQAQISSQERHQSPMWVVAVQTPVPVIAAFPGSLAGRWISGGIARAWTGAHTGYWHHCATSPKFPLCRRNKKKNKTLKSLNLMSAIHYGGFFCTPWISDICIDGMYVLAERSSSFGSLIVHGKQWIPLAKKSLHKTPRTN